MSYVLYFSKPFALAIAIWPFLSLLLTLPVLALLYHRDNRLRFTSALTAYLVVLYLIALACFTMYPMPENPATYCAATISGHNSTHSNSSTTSEPTASQASCNWP